ncbi:unnamed protein product [Spirodela intermedia]|uniref:Bifunctional inhibitor/plant lipid transfer protein/seed storage helical domain-containing protein n=1 Tax=Spirodela intermedia TaxID=51605 RepID=A0A7I8IQJ6_SPIIN|nr:unnamed protein product [Spirodela intermedia]CAA6660151.1 unnamed protein product [Spirodela intermedia]
MERSVLAVVLVLVVSVALGGATPAWAELRASQCERETTLGLNACRQLLFGLPPSKECCQRIRVTRLECVCPLITPSQDHEGLRAPHSLPLQVWK